MWANVAGALGIGANITIYQQKDRRRILIFKLISDVFWALHYCLLGAYSGCAVAVIGMAREGVFINRGRKKWATHPVWLALFLLVSAASAVLTWKNGFSILPACASILSVLSFWSGKPHVTRYAALPISLCMLTYDIASGSIMGLCNEILTLSSTTIGIVRFARSSDAKKH